MALLDSEDRTAATAIAITGYIYTVAFPQAPPGNLSWQERESGPQVTVGTDSGVKARVVNSSTVPAMLRTTIIVISPAGLEYPLIFEDEFSARQERSYEAWFTADEAGQWNARITLESI